MNSGRWFPCLLLSASCAPTLPDTAPIADLALTHATVVDVETGNLLPDRTVLIAGNRIVRIAPSPEIIPPAAGHVIDARGKYLIPGLWDMHAHTVGDRDTRDVLFPLFVVHGITGIRNMFGDCIAPCPARRTPIELLHDWRRQIAAGELLGPRVIASGPPIDGPNPTHPGSLAVANAREAREAVTLSKQRGADFIKVYAGLPRDAYFAVLEQARVEGLAVSGHVPWSVSVLEAVRAGHKSVEHFHTYMWQYCSTEEDDLRRERLEPRPGDIPRDSARALQRSRARRLLETYSEERCRTLMGAYVAHGAWQVPTLSAFPFGKYYEDDAVARESRLAFVPAWIREAWMASLANYRANNDPDDVAFGNHFEARSAQLVGDMHRAGVGILAGTDTPGPFTFPGSSLHEELALLVERAGLTPLEALRTATLAPARYFTATDSLGSVAEGRVADLVLLDANPLEDIRAIQRIHAVVLNGRPLERADLDQLMARTEEAAERQ